MSTHSRFSKLRERAEALQQIRHAENNLLSLSYAEMQALVHELQVHQIELEMQSEELYKTQQDLQESCDRFAELYDFAPIGYLTLDAQKQIVTANLSVAALLGTERSMLIGKKLSDFIAREEQDRFYLYCRDLFSDAPTESDTTAYDHYRHKHSCELAMRTAGGAPLWCRLDSMVFRITGQSAENAVPDLLCRLAMIDITECKLAEQARQESQAKLKILAETVPDILYVCDAQGRREYINPQFYQFTGLPPGYGEAYGWEAAIHPDDIEPLRSSRLSAMQRSTAWEGRFRMRSAAGDFHWFIGRMRPLQATYGKIEKWLGSDTDIDQLVRNEQALQAADRRKDEFLAMLSHELRNPLASIRNAVQLLRLQQPDVARIAWVRDILERNVTHMLRLVDDLLDTARITSGTIKLHKQCLELAVIVERAIETVQPLIASSDHTLHVKYCTQPLFVDGDFVRLTQVFTNILNNAAKYTAAGGRIDLEIGSDAAYAYVRIKDNGMGIPEDLLPRVFDLFRQDERGLDRSLGGLGIGLTLVKNIVELHGGEVTVRSAGKNQGADFLVRLPRLAVAEAPTASADSCSVSIENSPAPAEHRILLVEDNPDVADSLILLLELFGHSVETAADGAQGLAVARSFQPDVVLLDIGIPGMDGYELAERLRADEQFRDTLIVALSGYEQSSDDKNRGAASGIDHYLVKPADPERLRKLLAEHPSSRKLPLSLP
ncbi:MAG: hybrid sensor histidine kinase/response regulator [Gammaproteobacteria bacterium]